MPSYANAQSPSIPLVLVIAASDVLVERCRDAVGALARVLGASLDNAATLARGSRVRAIVVTVDAYGRYAQPLTDLARRLQARLVKLPTEQMPSRYLEDVLIAALGSSGTRPRV